MESLSKDRESSRGAFGGSQPAKADGIQAIVATQALDASPKPQALDNDPYLVSAQTSICTLTILIDNLDVSH